MQRKAGGVSGVTNYASREASKEILKRYIFLVYLEYNVVWEIVTQDIQITTSLL